MPGLLSPDSHLYQALSWIVTLVLTNLLAIVGFLLVFPGGVSWLVLFSAAALLIHEESVSRAVVWKVVRRNWVPATCLWLADLVFIGVVAWESFILTRMTSWVLYVVWGGLLCLGSLLVVLVNLWFWPLLVMRTAFTVDIHEDAGGKRGEDAKSAPHESEEKTRLKDMLNDLRVSLLMSLRYLPRSLVGVILLVAPLVCVGFFPTYFWKVLVYLGLFGIAFGVYLVFLVQYRPLCRILDINVEDTKLSNR